MSAPRRVLIAGGGIAGWTVASTLRDRGFDGEIVIVEREAACYDRPPLSKTVLVDGAHGTLQDRDTPLGIRWVGVPSG